MSPAIPIDTVYDCPRLADAADQGRASYASGVDDSPPHDRGTAEYFAWLCGWAGSKAIAIAFAEDHPDHGKEPA